MTKHKNLVFIFSDQQRYDTMACYGNDWIKAPRLNELSEESFIFERAYVSQPVCSPARATILTGLYPHTAGLTLNSIPLPKDKKTIAEYLPEDYATGYFGKWHIGNDGNPQHGFKEWVPTHDLDVTTFIEFDAEPGKSDYHNYLVEKGYEPDRVLPKSSSNLPRELTRDVPDDWEIFSSEKRSEVAAEDTMAHFLGRRAAEFIKDHSEEPFVLYISTFEPHSPYNGPYNGMYDPAALPTGPAFLKRPDSGTFLNRRLAENSLQFLDGSEASHNNQVERLTQYHDITSEYGWKKLRADYFANVTLVDEMVGMVVDALKEQGIYDDTVLAFTSEHGDMIGDHGMVQKMNMYEESARVPMLIRAPAVSTEKTMIGGNFGHVDLVPTLLDLLGCDVPDEADGKSVADVMKEGGSLRNNEVFMQWNGIGWVEVGPPDNRYEDIIVQSDVGTPDINIMFQAPWRSIVVNDWKLNLCASDQCELYNLKDDPYEMNNLYDHPEYQDVVRLLSTKVRMWQFRTRDDTPI